MPPSRLQLTQREIDSTLARYSIGKVHSINELAAGSVMSPKVVIESDRGKLLLKRRANGLDIPALVAFSHEVILGCLEQGVCIPPLLATADNQNSMVQLGDQVYELFVFIDGSAYDRAPTVIRSHAAQAGVLLSELHLAFDQITTTFEPARETSALNLSRVELLSDPTLNIEQSTIDHLRRMIGFGDELLRANADPNKLVHGDWHPGNMIFRQKEIVAICDFDNTRFGSRAREIAQAMIHCSIKLPQPGQPAIECAPEPDLPALGAFWSGLNREHSRAYSSRMIAGLMPAVMVDAALAMLSPVGHESDLEHAKSMLIAVNRKTRWLDEHQGELIQMLDSAK